MVCREDGKKKGEPAAKLAKGKKPAKGAAKKPAADTTKTDAKPKSGKKAKTNPDAGDKKLSAINPDSWRRQKPALVGV